MPALRVHADVPFCTVTGGSSALTAVNTEKFRSDICIVQSRVCMPKRVDYANGVRGDRVQFNQVPLTRTHSSD